MKSDEQKQHHGATNAQSQTKNINASIKLLLVEIAPGYFEIVSNHGFKLLAASHQLSASFIVYYSGISLANR